MTLPRLQAPGLELVPLTPADAGDLQHELVEPELRRVLMDDQVVEQPAIVELIEAARAIPPLGIWRIARHEAPFVGAVALRPVAAEPGYAPTVPPDAVEVVIALAPACWGRGIAATAVRTLEAHAARLGLDALHALIDVPNHRSRRLFDRLGYRLLGQVPGAGHPIEVLARKLEPAAQ